MLVDPQDEVPGLAGRVEHECRGPLHLVLDHRGGHPAAHVDDLHAAVVGCHQRPLTGAQRDEEIALCMLAVYSERTGETHGDLCHAGEVLDVAPGHRRVKGVVLDVVQSNAGILFDEFLALADDVHVIVVLLVAGYLLPGFPGLDDRIRCLEIDHPVGFCLTGNRDPMFRVLGKGYGPRMEHHVLAHGEFQGLVLRDLRRLEPGAVVAQDHVVQADLQAIDAEIRHTGDDPVLHGVLDGE
ncbi:MAG: hypothetical protein BWX71_02608 [Deltaproteobacteria bacterium ADurb.Bin072]|nr:MAG: hypothetical protein BWX71_02608 [Deltaproteobacteria bacterium ADurb.Bin072]